MKVPTPAILFGSQLTAYFLATVGIRAAANSSYLWTGLSDVVLAAVNFLAISKVADLAQGARGPALVGYVAGGTVGSLLAIFATSRLWP